MSLSGVERGQCFLSVYLSNKVFFLYWLRLRGERAEVVKVPFRVELQVRASEFVWRRLTLFMHCQNEI